MSKVFVRSKSNNQDWFFSQDHDEILSWFLIQLGLKIYWLLEIHKMIKLYPVFQAITSASIKKQQVAHWFSHMLCMCLSCCVVCVVCICLSTCSCMYGCVHLVGGGACRIWLHFHLTALQIIVTCQSYCLQEFLGQLVYGTRLLAEFIQGVSIFQFRRLITVSQGSGFWNINFLIELSLTTICREKINLFSLPLAQNPRHFKLLPSIYHIFVPS